MSDLEQNAIREMWHYWSTAVPSQWWRGHTDPRYMYGTKHDYNLQRLIKWRLGDPRLQQVK